LNGNGGEKMAEDETPVEEEKTAVEKVKENLEILKEINDKMEAELLRGEEIRAKIQMGGKSEAGEATVVVEETAKEYADKIMSGKKND